MRHLEGQRFGRLTVIERIPEKDFQGKCYLWRCICDCGKQCEVRGSSLVDGSIRSCGCLQRDTKAEQAIEMQKHIVRVGGTNINLLESKKIYSNNSSWIKGVSWKKSSQKWVARIQLAGKAYSLGNYEKIEDAIKARKKAEAMLHDDFVAWYKSQIQK